MSKLEVRLVYLYISYCSINLLYSLQIPFYPIIAQQKGLSSWQMGTVFCLRPVMSMFASAYLGVYLYKFGRRLIYFLAFIIGGLSLIIVSFIVELPYWPFLIISYISSMLGGISLGMVYVAQFSIIANEYEERSTQVLGIAEAFAGFGLMSGPAVGAVLYDLIGFIGIHLLCGCVIFAIAFPSLTLFKTKQITEDEPDDDFSVKKYLTRPVNYIQIILFDFIALITSNTAAAFIDILLGSQLHNLGFKQYEIGIAYFLVQCSYMIAAVLLSWKGEIIGHKFAMISGLVMQFIGTFFMCNNFGLTWSGWSIIGACLVNAALSLHFTRSLLSMIDSCYEYDEELVDYTQLNDALSGLSSVGIFVGEIIGPVLAGVLYDILGPSNAFISLSGLVLLIILSYVIVFLHSRRQLKELNIPLLQVKN